MTGISLPQHHPSPRELDDLELLLSGALAPLTGFNEPGSPVTIALPEDEWEALRESRVELVDPEGLPLAEMDRWGRLTPRSTPAHGPFRSLYLSPAQARETLAGRTWVPVAGPLTRAQLDELADAGPVVLLALVGTGTPELTPVGLLRASLAAADLLADARVVAVPLAAHGDAEADHRLGLQVVDNYAGDDPVLALADDDGELPEPIAEVVDFDQPPADERGLVVFFTGLSGSGKSTLARAFMDRVLEHGRRTVTTLDGDVVRRHLSAGLTFSKEDRETNIRRIGWVAAEIARHGGLAVCSPIAPYDETRQQVRTMVEEAGGEFFLVHVATPLAECERRDRKGLYAKARRGEIAEFTGISSPYEEPQDAAVVIDTTGRTIPEALEDLLSALREDGLIDLDAEPADPAAAPPAPPVRPARPDTAGSPDVERPAPVMQAQAAPADAPLRVLFVCTANICRSAYLHNRAAAMLADDSSVEVSSAGTHGFDAHGVADEMHSALDAAGVPWHDFRSRRLTADDVREADLVLTAEDTHRQFILDEVPAAFRKVFTVGQFAETVAIADPDLRGRALLDEAMRQRVPASEAQGIADPYRRGVEASAAATAQMDELLDQILPRLTRPESVDSRENH